MEKRAILAALLMAALLMLYQILFVSPPEPRREPSQKTAAPPAPPGPSPAPAAPAPPPTAVEAIPPKEAEEPPERTALVQTPLYRAQVGSRGGALQSWELNYRGQKPMIVSGELGPRGLTVVRAGGPARLVQFGLSTESLRLDPGRRAGEIRLVGEDGFGLRVTQTLRFWADSYMVEQDVRVENRHEVAQAAEVALEWAAPVEWPREQAEKFQGQYPTRVVRLAAGNLHREDLAKTASQRLDGQWVGLESEWYLAALIPRSPGIQLVEAKATQERPGLPKPAEVAEIGLRAALPTLAPGQSWEGRVWIYVGPKEYARLKAFGVGLEQSIYFGGFPVPQSWGGLPMEWVVVPILWLMHWFYGFAGNYGIAIILLTVITKVLFFPLSVKSMRSMKAMQVLQPQVNALRAKHKNDPQRLQQETMELYRRHGANPLGGCLPMVVQIPIFYALYVALAVSVELQNAPFIRLGTLPRWVPGLGGECVWICDLAAHDPTYVLPLLMGASMFIQQKMMPVADPRQAKMMLFMPVIFTFMFLSLPSGLVLYWTLSNVLQILQQMYMERAGKAAGKAAEKAPARAAKKA